MASEIGKLVDYLRARNLSFYHFTDSRNLESVKDRGLLSLRLLKEGGIDFVPGGNDWSHEADAYKGVDRHVHLSFTSNHPMEFVATREKRIEKSVVLKVRPEIIATAGAQISLGVANASGVEILDAEDAIAKLDLAALYPKTVWRDDETWERFKVARKWELLVPDRVAPKFIENL